MKDSINYLKRKYVINHLLSDYYVLHYYLLFWNDSIEF